MVSPGAGWHPDPTDRYEFRYHNGTDWTADVAESGRRFVDPMGTTTRPAGPPQHVAGPAGGRRNGLAVASLVLGIIALTTGPLPFLFVVGAVCGVLAIVFGIVGLRRSRDAGRGRSSAIAGLITGGIGLASVALGVVLTIVLVDALDAYDDPGPFELGDLECAVTSTTDDVPSWTASGTITNLDDDERDYSIRVEYRRGGTDNVQRSTLVELDDVAAGETRDFEVARAIDLDDVDCVVDSVRGPLPFGIDLGR